MKASTNGKNSQVNDKNASKISNPKSTAQNGKTNGNGNGNGNVNGAGKGNNDREW